MRGELFGGQGWAVLASDGLVEGDARFDGVVAEVPAGAGGEQGIVAQAAPLGQPDPHDGRRGGGERDTALLAAFPGAPDMRPGAEYGIPAAQPGQLR